jgi:hypothetical protein
LVCLFGLLVWLLSDGHVFSFGTDGHVLQFLNLWLFSGL